MAIVKFLGSFIECLDLIESVWVEVVERVDINISIFDVFYEIIYLTLFLL